MSNWDLEEDRQAALKKIVQGKKDFMQGDDFDKKKNGFAMMKEGTILLTKYAKKEDYKPYREQAAQKVKEYLSDLEQMKQYIDTYEQNQ